MFDTIDNSNIDDAIKLWVTDEEAAMKQYGHISKWDVSNCFYLDFAFNGLVRYVDGLAIDVFVYACAQ